LKIEAEAAEAAAAALSPTPPDSPATDSTVLVSMIKDQIAELRRKKQERDNAMKRNKR
jgi:hypothetical protein